jgi:membrane-bound lytic murein transglycosylase D
MVESLRMITKKQRIKMQNVKIFKNLTKLMLSILIITTLTNSAVADPHMRNEILTKKSAWELISAEAQLNDFHKHARVEHFIKAYLKNQTHVKVVSERAEPFLFHIIEQLRKRDLPIELALLPMIESAYIVNAQSNRGAAGIWQIQTATGEIYGLYEDQWFDSRQDIAKATNAAIELLSELNERFNGDWLLTLAAYNAGAGRVSQAIKRNLRDKKPTDFWSLSLPQETRDFVPKFLAISNVMQNAQEYGISINHIPHSQVVQLVTVRNQTDLRVIAKLAGLSLNEVKTLNPGFKTNLTRPNKPDQILLPVDNARVLARKININDATKNNKIKIAKNTINKNTHTVINTLAKLAESYKTTVEALMSKNKIPSADLIVVGQVLVV